MTPAVLQQRAAALVKAGLDRYAQAKRPRTAGAPSDAAASIRSHILTGVAAVALLVGGLGVWAAGSEIAGAVVAAGHLVVESHVKAVQHPSGGVVGELNVRNGDQVEAGDVLLRLDDTQTRANLAIVTKALDELLARRARLLAERDGLEQISFPAELTNSNGGEYLAQLLDGETKLFSLRRAARAGQRDQLQKRIAQLDEEVAGLEAQRGAKEHEIAIIRKELASVKSLWKKKLVEQSRLLELERQETRLNGELGELIASAAQVKGRITETELAIGQIEHDLRSEVARELRDTDAQVAELSERKVAAEQLLRQTLIRAPQSGRVHELAVHTIGGVIGAGESVLQIVPSADELTVEARVAPQDIDQVHPGQPAFLRLSAFHQQTTPEVTGKVLTVSPDLIEDKAAGMRYYVVRVGLGNGDVPAALHESLKPGMPVEVFLRTTDRTVMSYLLKPISDQVTRAFRE